MATGFPSPAEDYIDQALDLNEHLIKHPAATFFIKAKGNHLREHGIQRGDLILIDRSLKPRLRDIVLAVVNGEFCLKPMNSLRAADKSDFTVWGVVTYSIHQHR